jgi:hypothetical protein
VLSRLPKLLLALALASSIGLHWAFFQTLAWTQMVISYSQNAPLSEALVKTFDGKHPCKLCKNIAESKRSEKHSDSDLDLKKFEFSFVASEFAFSAPAFLDEPSPSNDSAAALVRTPPVPPPRQLLA